MQLTLSEILTSGLVFAGIFAVGALFGGWLGLALSGKRVKLLRMPTIGHLFRGKGKETTS